VTRTRRVWLGASASLIVFIVAYVLFFDGSRTLLFSALGLTLVLLNFFVFAGLARRRSREAPSEPAQRG
jgi:hypothetical protein